jgi:hypothetical protein
MAGKLGRLRSRAMLAIASFIIHNLGWQARSRFLSRLSEMPQLAQVNSPRWHSYTLARLSELIRRSHPGGVWSVRPPGRPMRVTAP